VNTRAAATLQAEHDERVAAEAVAAYRDTLRAGVEGITSISRVNDVWFSGPMVDRAAVLALIDRETTA
jgi:hypothetical protein